MLRVLNLVMGDAKLKADSKKNKRVFRGRRKDLLKSLVMKVPSEDIIKKYASVSHFGDRFGNSLSNAQSPNNRFSGLNENQGNSSNSLRSDKISPSGGGVYLSSFASENMRSKFFFFKFF